MNWLKNALVDVVVTVLIIVSVFNDIAWLNYLIYGYTGLILLMKIITYSNEALTRRIKKSAADVPEWFLHVLYAINLGVLVGFQRWYLALGWGLIWALSYLIQQRVSRVSAAAAARKGPRPPKKKKRS